MSACGNPACNSGWLPIGEQYVNDRLVAQGQLGTSAPPPPAGHAEALRNTVRPCEICNPDGYQLWATGHYALHHSCEECQPRSRR